MSNFSLNFFTSTKGHFGVKTLYKYTLNDENKLRILFATSLNLIII